MRPAAPSSRERPAEADAAGFGKIQHIPDYSYDGLYRLTAAEYDLGGGTTKHEDCVYDDLGRAVGCPRDPALKGPG